MQRQCATYMCHYLTILSSTSLFDVLAAKLEMEFQGIYYTHSIKYKFFSKFVLFSLTMGDKCQFLINLVDHQVINCWLNLVQMKTLACGLVSPTQLVLE